MPLNTASFINLGISHIAVGRSMLFGRLLIAAFFATLPWVWISVFYSGFHLRPSVVAAAFLFLYVLLRREYSFGALEKRALLVVLVVFVVWLSPVIYFDHPHWEAHKVISVFLYFFLAYSAARVYLSATEDGSWDVYWPIIGLTFLVSSLLCFYTAFGGLTPNMSIKDSSEFIYNELYANMFADAEEPRGGGIRHTMALAPVLLMALVVHNKKTFPKLGTAIFLISIYLVLYSFSRSAWLSAFLVVLVSLRSVVSDFSKIFTRIIFTLIAGAVVLITLAMTYPEQFSWVFGILGDRLADDRSTEGRIWVIGYLFSDTTFSEFLLGYNRPFQTMPHNLILDAMMQAGVLGGIAALFVVIYAARIYFTGLMRGGVNNIVAAAFVAPALVRVFSAGSGMLHMTELFGLSVAMIIRWESKKRSPGVSSHPVNSQRAMIKPPRILRLSRRNEIQAGNDVV